MKEEQARNERSQRYNLNDKEGDEEGGGQGWSEANMEINSGDKEWRREELEQEYDINDNVTDAGKQDDRERQNED